MAIYPKLMVPLQMDLAIWAGRYPDSMSTVPPPSSVAGGGSVCSFDVARRSNDAVSRSSN